MAVDFGQSHDSFSLIFWFLGPIVDKCDSFCLLHGFAVKVEGLRIRPLSEVCQDVAKKFCRCFAFDRLLGPEHRQFLRRLVLAGILP